MQGQARDVYGFCDAFEMKCVLITLHSFSDIKIFLNTQIHNISVAMHITETEYRNGCFDCWFIKLQQQNISTVVPLG